MLNTAIKKHFHYFVIISYLIPCLVFSPLYGQKGAHQKNLVWLQQQKSAGNSIVLLNNEQGLVPIKDVEQKIASVNLGSVNAIQFDSLLNKYTTVASFSLLGDNTDSSFNQLNDDLKFYKTIIIQVDGSALNDRRTINFIYDIQRSKQLILAVYGKHTFLKYADKIYQPMIWSIKDSPATANIVAQIIFGGMSVTAKLERTYTGVYHKNAGFNTAAIRLQYTVPEETGIDVADLNEPIDSIAAEAISKHAIPGAVVMVVKDGKVIFNKAYGYHTYDSIEPMKISDIFDMASVTKVSATTIAVMRLYEQQKISLDSGFGYYIASARNTNKSDIKIRSLLMHQSGIQPGVGLPLLPQDINADSSSAFPLKAGDKTFIRTGYFKEMMWPLMLHVKLDSIPKYSYSDLSMTYMKEIVERQSLQKLDEYVAAQFYLPLGMQSAGFNPLHRFEISRIVPTEQEDIFRKAMLRGYVHDPMAARYGGVSGNAGLFATANDLAILYQMILNRGTYGDIQYFNPETIDLFTSKQSSISRRGFGFDRKDPDSTKNYPSKLASSETYGHTGFTGTCFWVDPKYNLIFIFLSNRVYPKATSTLYTLYIQPRMMDAIYGAIKKTRQADSIRK